MARPLRIEYPGAVYHVTSRGNARADIFADTFDRQTFLLLLESVVNRFNWICHAYCLMDNHYHLLIETSDGNLSMGMRHLNGVYTQSFNRRHKRVGHVFQGRFKAVIVEKESHLLELCRYVVLNPVRAGMVFAPQKWRWSSYSTTAGNTKKEPYLATDWILGQFDKTKSEARIKYRQFVKDGMSEKKAPWEKLRGQVILGSDMFIERVREFIGGKDQITEIPRRQRTAGRPSLEVLFPAGERLTKRERNPTILEAHVKYGYSLKEIAEHLGVHYTTVSKVVKGEMLKK
jgi:REP element-mobilizing transposase RayT